MGILDRIFGTEPPAQTSRKGAVLAANDDQRAIERYRYMVRTAPPETLEQAHEEAFARLTPEQRKAVLAELERTAPPEEAERARAHDAEEPSALARFATRAEYRQRGTVERALSGAGGGFASLVPSFLAAFAGSMVAQSFFDALDDAGMSEEASRNAGDFSEEFGQGSDDQGLAGGEGFDGDDFDPLV